MIILGKKQELKIVKKVEFGIYLAEEEALEERVLLPKKQVPEGVNPGDSLTVFVYKDSKDRLISTTQEPKMELGGIARRNRWLEKGEKAFLKAKEALESAGIRDGNYATTINNLAGHYRVAGDFERSARYFSLCRELYEAMPELPVDVLASVCNNLGLLHLDAKRYSEAMDEFLRAGEMIVSIPENHYVQAVTAGNRAYAHYGLGERDAAREWMGRAAKESEKIEGAEGELCRHYRKLYAQLGGKL